MHSRNISNKCDLFTSLFYFLFSSVAYWHFKCSKVHLSSCWKTSDSISITSSAAALFPSANDQMSLSEKHHMSSEKVVLSVSWPFGCSFLKFKIPCATSQLAPTQLSTYIPTVILFKSPPYTVQFCAKMIKYCLEIQRKSENIFSFYCTTDS